MKSSYIKLIGPVASLMLITGNVLGQTANPPNNGGGNGLQQQVAALQAQVAALQASNDELRSRLQYLSLSGKDMFITGANLHIVSGSGATDGTVNGLGNLIVGYNESRGAGADDRSGSHNIVVGESHNYSSFGGLVAGFRNTISGSFCSVSGGVQNTAGGETSSVSGGTGNTAAGSVCWVGGGYLNTASDLTTSISGGAENTANGLGTSVSGGVQNTANGVFCSVSGGVQNTAGGETSSVSGGTGNTASGAVCSVSGGQNVFEATDYGWAGGSYHTP